MSTRTLIEGVHGHFCVSCDNFNEFKYPFKCVYCGQLNDQFEESEASVIDDLSQKVKDCIRILIDIKMANSTIKSELLQIESLSQNVKQCRIEINALLEELSRFRNTKNSMNFMANILNELNYNLKDIYPEIELNVRT